MVELAWFWLRHQPNSPLSIWFRERVGTAKGRIRRIAIVAVAPKLLIALWLPGNWHGADGHRSEGLIRAWSLED
jgi:hypothetical protein